MTDQQDDLIPRLERAIASEDPALNGQPRQANSPAPQPEQPRLAPPPAETMDFAQEPAQTPIDAGAPEQQAPMPPAQQPAPAPQTAQQIGAAYEQANAQAQQQRNSALDQRESALADAAGIEMNRNDAAQGARIERHDKEAQFQKVRDELDRVHLEETQRGLEEFDKNVAEEKALAQKDPHDFWGTSSVINKIGAVIGMIGAGLAHKDTHKYFQDIVNNRVAETERKRHIYQTIGHDLRYKNYLQENKHRTENSRVEAKRVAAIDEIDQRLAIAQHQYDNPQVQANYAMARAGLAKERADAAGKAVDDITHKRLDIHRARLDEMRAQNERDYKNASLGLQADKQAHAGASGYLPVAGISNEGVMKNQQGQKFVEDQAITGDLLNSLDNFEKVTQGADTLDVKQQQLAVQKAFVSGDIRKKLGVGARVEGEEGKNMSLLLPAFNDYFAGKIGYGDLKQKINEIRDLIINSHVNRFNAVRSPNSEITPDYPLYKQIQAYGQRKQAEDDASVAIDNTIAKDAGNPEKAILDVSALGTPQAKARAAQMQEELHPSLKHRAGQLLHRFKESVL